MSEVTFTRSRSSWKIVQGAFTLDDPRIQPEPNTGCWLWARKVDKKGYATTVVPGVRKGVKVHRAVWEKAHGPIPKDLVLDHRCRERSCCNPDHLRVVTPRENALFNSLGQSAKNMQKTACPKCGGPYTLVKCHRKMRECKSCKAIYQRSRRAAKTESRYA